MGNGYVLDFQNTTFADFFRLDFGIDIYDVKFSNHGESKAKRLRSFFENASDQLVGRVLEELLEHGQVSDCLGAGELEKGILLAQRLKASTAPDFAALVEASDSVNDSILLCQIEDSLHQDEPQGVLDRLHTLTVRFVRRLCTGRGIQIMNTSGDAKPLHSIFGEYVKQLRATGQIESEMGERIFRSSISVLEAFNDVRNKQSLAHDNPVLGRPEATLIVGNISGLIKYVQAVETQIAVQKNAEAKGAVAPMDDFAFPPEEELPF